MKDQNRKTTIRIHNLNVKIDLPENIENDIRTVAKATFDQEKFFGSYQLSIVLTSDEEIKEMNLRYLQKDRTTDVMCFPYATGKQVQSDIFISVDSAQAQAEQYTHTIKQEILFLVIHGILHLIGWNDDSDGRRNQMWGRQEQILKSVC
ncbi:MAG: rRNA maturation RNase YbeY [Elusimicrobiota bacterium]